MHYAKDCIMAMKTVIREMHTTYHALKEEVSALDKEISSLYHEIERTPFDRGGMVLYARLQEALQKRRYVKAEWHNLYNLISALGTYELRKTLSQVEHSIYIQARRMKMWKNGDEWNHEHSEEVAKEPISIANAVIEVVNEMLNKGSQAAS